MIVINTFTALFLAGACFWAVMSPRVRDGIVIKVGLILMAVGYMVIAHALTDGMDCSDVRGLARAALLTRVGLLIVLGGWYWRSTMRKRHLGRMSDWVRSHDGKGQP